MKIQLSSVMVDDQDKALKFYTEVMGFVKKQDVPLGEFRWLTVASPEGPEDIELVLEPNSNPAAKTYQAAIFQQGIPLTAFAVDDIQQEHSRLKKLGVAFTKEPTDTGPVTMAVFDNTCGNLIQMYRVRSAPSSPPFDLTVERDMGAPPDVLFRAWTDQFDRWFPSPGSVVLMNAEVNAPFYFETHHEAQRYHHYGRFLRLERDRLVELTWVTGPQGTRGAETVVTVELAPQGTGTRVRLTHAGFPDEASRNAYEAGWPMVLERLEQRLRQPL